MAHIQEASHLMRIFDHHPVLATLFISSVTLPLLGLWGFNGLPVPLYGRLLTEAEAHAPVFNTVVKTLPAPNIPPIDVFGHPHTISFSAAPQFAKPQSSSDTFQTPVLSTDAENVISLSRNLIGMVGAAAVIALLAVAFKSSRANNKPVTNQYLVRYLKGSLDAERAKTATAEDNLQRAQSQLAASQSSFISTNSNLSTALNELSTLRSDVVRLTRENENRAYSLKSAKTERGEAAVAQKNFTIISLKGKVQELRAAIEHFDTESTVAGAALIGVLTAIDDFKDQLSDPQSKPGTNALISLEAAAQKCNQFIKAHMTMIAKRELNINNSALNITNTGLVHTDKQREIRYMDWTNSSPRAEVLRLSGDQAGLVDHLRDVQKHSFDLQQTNSELKKHSFRVHEHGLGLYALDVERDNSEYDLAVAMHALEARDNENRALTSDIELALQALNNHHEGQKRELLSQLDASQKELESTLTFQQTTLMCLGQLQQSIEAQVAQLSAKDFEIGSLRQEQEKTLAEFDLAKQDAVAKGDEIAQLNLDLSSKDSEIGSLRQKQEKVVAELLLTKQGATAKDSQIAQLHWDKDDLAKKLHKAEKSDEAKTAIVEVVRLRKANISAQLDTTSSYLKKAIDQKEMVSKQLEIAKQASEKSSADFARALREKDDIARQLQQLKQSDKAKAAIIKCIRREKVGISAQLVISSSNLKVMVDEKDMIVKQLVKSQQVNKRQSAELTQALQEKDEISSQIQQLKQADEKKTAEELEIALQWSDKQHVAQIEDMEAAHQIAIDEAVKIAQMAWDQDAEANTNEFLHDLRAAIDTLLDEKKTLLFEREEAVKQIEASRAMYEESQKDAEDLQGNLDDANRHSGLLQDVNDKQNADLNFERERYADELVDLQRKLEDAGACSETLRKANDEQKASIELERQTHADDLANLQHNLEEVNAHSMILQQANDKQEVTFETQGNFIKQLQQDLEKVKNELAETRKQEQELKETERLQVHESEQNCRRIQDLEGNLGTTTLELKNAESGVQEAQGQRDDAVSQYERSVEHNQALEKNLEAAKAELRKTQSRVRELEKSFSATKVELGNTHLQVQKLEYERDDVERQQTREIEQQQDLEKILTAVNVELNDQQSQMKELHEQHNRELVQKDTEFIDKTRELEEQSGRQEKSQKHIQGLEKQLALIAVSSAAAEIDSEDVITTNTSATSNIDKVGPGRIKIDASFNWSKRSRRNDWKWCVRAGIVQQGPCPDKQLVKLKLPHADPFYSDLPLPIPKPCSDSDVGERNTCGHCHETYLTDPTDYYHEHGPLCMLFFSHHAIACKHCKKVFYQNKAFKEHELDCGEHYTPGAAPEVLAHLAPLNEFAILDAHMTLLPPSHSFLNIAALKNNTLGTSVDSHTLVRGLLPHADPDYAQCSLPKPGGQTSVLPLWWPGDKFAGKTLCKHCNEWYQVGQIFKSHLDACRSFFLGLHNVLPHIRCEHCGDVYRKNAGFTQHKIVCQKYARKTKCTWCPEVVDLNSAEHQARCHLNPRREYVANLGTASSSPSSTAPPNTPTGPTNCHLSRRIQQTHTPSPAQFIPSGDAPTFVPSSDSKDTTRMPNLRGPSKASLKKTLRPSSPLPYFSNMDDMSDTPHRQYGNRRTPSSSPLAPQSSRQRGKTSRSSSLSPRPPSSSNPPASPNTLASPNPPTSPNGPASLHLPSSPNQPGSPFQPPPGPGQA